MVARQGREGGRGRRRSLHGHVLALGLTRRRCCLDLTQHHPRRQQDQDQDPRPCRQITLLLLSLLHPLTHHTITTKIIKIPAKNNGATAAVKKLVVN